MVMTNSAYVGSELIHSLNLIIMQNETTKRGLKSVESEVAAGHCFTLLVCLDVGLRTLAPFMPYLSQHLHQHLTFHLKLPLERGFPQNLKWANDEIENDVQNVLDTVVAIRRLQKLFNVSKKDKPQVRLVSQLPVYKELLEAVEDLTGCDKVTISLTEEMNAEEAVCDTVGSHTVVYLSLPYEFRKTLDIDLSKLERKRNKVVSELNKIQKMIAAESYHINAPLKVQQTHAKKIQTLEDELFRIKYLANLHRV